MSGMNGAWAGWGRWGGRLILALTLGWLVAGCAGGGTQTKQSAAVRPAGMTAGSESDEAYFDTLRVGDRVQIVFTGNPTPPTDQDERIKEDGMINLQFIGPVQAAGKTSGQLQKEIQEAYVPRLFQRLTVTVRTEERMFFVDGEVRQPGGLFYRGQMTVLKAVASAGGFTDFAARKRIELVRSSGEVLEVNADKAKRNPALDVPVIPGDRIYVPRRSPFGR